MKKTKEDYIAPEFIIEEDEAQMDPINFNRSRRNLRRQRNISFSQDQS